VSARAIMGIAHAPSINIETGKNNRNFMALSLYFRPTIQPTG
jgi:hypothetical protein